MHYPRRRIVIIVASFCFLFGYRLPVQADEIVISANGAESNNAVFVASSSQTAVQQTNTSTVTNTVSTSADTGANTASGNTGGDVGIQTGDTSEETILTNTANTSVVLTDCCNIQEESSLTVSDNGAGSTNNVTLSQQHNTQVTITQHATISNTLSGTAVTGNNSANNNSGNVVIITGDIKITEKIKNGPINASYVSVPSKNQNSGGNVQVSGNGTHSVNNVLASFSNNSSIFLTNLAEVMSVSVWDLTTGGNEAKKNNGDVVIKTGDITYKTIIENGPVNVSSVTLPCCEEEKIPTPQEEKPAPTPAQPSPTPTPSGVGGPLHGNGGVGGGQGVGGDVLAAALGKILPVTGTNWLFFATLANIVMLFLGVFLRLRSGRSPGFVVQI